MSNQTQSPYSGITPEELHIVIRRAHAERAKAMRELFAALFAWRKRAAERRHAADPALRTAGSH